MNSEWMNSLENEWLGSGIRETLEDLRNEFRKKVDPRMKKGDVKLAILRTLADKPMHGYQIMQEIQTRSDGAWKPSAGSVYPTLALLTDEGLISASETEGRRVYSLTAAGREFVEIEADQPEPWHSGASRTPGPRGEVIIQATKLLKEATEVARRGSPKQLENAMSVIDDAASKLKELLTQN
jgi:DNA-binding PadR family transcriptional regulator